MVRSVTRADLDGLVCTVLLKQVEEVNSIFFTEAFPLQNGMVEIYENDIISNLPFLKGCKLWFDHHASNEPTFEFQGSWWVAPSAARVVYDYYKDKRLHRFADMVHHTDRVDSAELTPEEIAHPSGYFLIELTLNPKNLADEMYWLQLIEDLADSASAEVVLSQPECRQRAESVLNELNEYRFLLQKHSVIEHHFVISDFRTVSKLPAENRFLVYGMYPQAQVSVKLANVETKNRAMVKISLGRSIVNKLSRLNLGNILAEFGGGGHAAAGSVHTTPEQANDVLRQLLQKLKQS